MATVNHNERGSTSVLRPFQGDRTKHDSSSDASALEDFKRAVWNSPLTFKQRRGNVDGPIQHAYGEIYKGSLKSFEEFYRQMHESEGFEVDYFPDVVAIDMNVPIEIDDVQLNLLNPCSVLAIEMYNKEQKTNFKFVKIVAITVKIIRNVLYYISFEAEDKNSAEPQPIIFQTVVSINWIDKGDNDMPVIFCRRKSTKKPDFGQGLTVKELFNRGLSARPLLNR